MEPAPLSSQGEWIRRQKINMQSSLAQYNIVNKVCISIPPNLNQKNLNKDGIVERWRFDDPRLHPGGTICPYHGVTLFN